MYIYIYIYIYEYVCAYIYIYIYTYGDVIPDVYGMFTNCLLRLRTLQ